MRGVLLGLCALAFGTAASAQVFVNGYVKSDGTYVAPHYRSSPDSSPYNNYSTRGNVSPYTGQVGTKNPYGSSSNSYGSGNSSSNYGGYGNSSTKPKGCTSLYYC